MKWAERLAWVVWIAMMMLLAGCPVEQNIQSVDHNQDYVMPEKFVIQGQKMSPMDVIAKCGARTHGCITKISGDLYNITYTKANTLVHECEHLAYGPKHRGE